MDIQKLANALPINITNKINEIIDKSSDLQQWKTFPLSASALDVSGWTRNAIVIPSVWLDSIAYSATTIKDAVMVVIPKWASAGDAVTACTFAQTEGPTVPIIRGNILLAQFGADGKISSSFSLPASAMDTLAQFKALSVTGNVTIGGTLSGASGSFSGTVSGASGSFSGLVSGASGSFSGLVSGASGSFSGSVSGATANFSGNMVAQGNVVSHGHLIVDGSEEVSNISVGLNVGGPLKATGPVGCTNLSATNNATVGGTLNVTGASTFTGDVKTSGKLITPIIGSYTANVDLTTYVVDHSMVSGQHLFILNAGTTDITVTGKVLSGSSEISKTWTLAVGTAIDFIAVPITDVAPNAIAKLG